MTFSLKPQIKINLSLALLLVLIAVFAALVIGPIFSVIKNNPRDLAVIKQNLLMAGAKAANLEKFKKDYPEIAPNLEKTDAIFINAELPVEFVGFLEEISKEYRISLSISPSSASVQTDQDPWPFTFFQVNFSAAYADFLKFLDKLESSRYLIEVQNMNIVKLVATGQKTKEPEKLPPGTVNVSLSLKVYSR